MKVKIQEAAVTEIPEVLAFEEAKRRIQEFQNANSHVFEVYNALLNEYNAQLQAADKAVRAAGVKCGSWDLYSAYPKYDAQRVYEALGRETFLAVGGSITTDKKYKLNSKQFEVAAAAGRVPRDLYELCTSTECKYHAPKEVGTP